MCLEYIVGSIGNKEKRTIAIGKKSKPRDLIRVVASGQGGIGTV